MEASRVTRKTVEQVEVPEIGEKNGRKSESRRVLVGASGCKYSSSDASVGVSFHLRCSWQLPTLPWRFPLLTWKLPLLSWKLPLLPWSLPPLPWELSPLPCKLPLIPWECPSFPWDIVCTSHESFHLLPRKTKSTRPWSKGVERPRKYLSDLETPVNWDQYSGHRDRPAHCIHTYSGGVYKPVTSAIQLPHAACKV